MRDAKAWALSLVLCAAVLGAYAYKNRVVASEGTASAHYNQGLTYSNQQQWPAAEAELRAALVLDPGLTDARLALGVALHQQGQFDEAIREYTAVAAANPNSAAAFYDIGVAQAAARRFDEALQAYSKAVVLDPKSADIEFNLGYLLFHDLGRPQEAVPHFRRALELNPKMEKAVFQLSAAQAQARQ